VLVVKHHFGQQSLKYVQVLSSLLQCPIIQISHFASLNSSKQSYLFKITPQI